MRKLTKTVVPEIAELKLELRYVIGIVKLPTYSFNKLHTLINTDQLISID